MKHYRLWSVIAIADDDGSTNTGPTYPTAERAVSRAPSDLFDDLPEGHRDAQRALREHGRYAQGGFTFVLQTSEIEASELDQLEEAQDVFGIDRFPWAMYDNQREAVSGR